MESWTPDDVMQVKDAAFWKGIVTLLFVPLCSFSLGCAVTEFAAVQSLKEKQLMNSMAIAQHTADIQQLRQSDVDERKEFADRQAAMANLCNKVIDQTSKLIDLIQIQRRVDGKTQ